MGTGKKILLIGILIVLAVVAVWLGLTKVRAPAPSQQAAKPDSVMAVTLYFGQADGSGLVPEARDIKATDVPLESVKRVLEALLAGPTGGGVALIPPAVKVRGVYIDGKTAYVDFSQELVDGFAGGSAGEYLLVASIVQTVCGACPDVQAVRILVGGQELDSIGGHLDVSRPLYPRDWR
jgi:spore germination protein GerM